MFNDQLETKRTVTMTYTFDFYEDQEEIKNLVSYRDAYSKLFDIYNLVRTELKHGDEELSDHMERLLEDIKELAWID